MPPASHQSLPAVVLLMTASLAFAQISLRTVAVTGERAPGNPAGINFLAFEFKPTINNSGNVSFGARISPPSPGSGDRRGIWSDVSGQLERIAQEGEPAPTPGTSYGGTLFTSSAISDNGHIGFCGEVYPPINDFASGGVLARYYAGQGTIIAQDWQHAPGTPANIRYENVCTRGPALVFVPPAMNADGHISYYSQFLNATSPGIWKTTPAGTLLVARAATPATGAGPNVNFATFGTPDGGDFSLGSFTQLNDAGNTSFFATLSGSGVTPDNNRGIWYEPGGALNLAVRSGDTPPNFDPAIKFSGFGDPALNNADHLAFRATFSGIGIDSTNDTSIWFKSAGGLSLVAREGAQAPGLSPGTLFGQMRIASQYEVILNGNDDAAFISDVSGPDVTSQNDSVLWAQHNGVLGLIAREGDQAPGMPAGLLLGNGNFGDFFAQMNDPGQIVFKASVTGPGITTANDDAYWAVLADGTTFPIIRDGDVIEVRPGDFRTISSVFQTRLPTGGQDGRQRTLNDFGEFTFGATFTDGSQAILVATIPEPTTLLLLVASILTRPMPFTNHWRRRLQIKLSRNEKPLHEIRSSPSA